MKFNRVFKLVLSLLLVMSTFSTIGNLNKVSADSGASALPPKDSPFHQWAYKTYAPKSQTTYKHFQTTSRKVSQIKKSGNDMVAFGNDLVMSGTFAGLLSGKKKFKLLKFPILSQILVGTGAVIYANGRATQIQYSKIANEAVAKSEVYFKWTNSARLEYSVKVISYIVYKGKVISNKNTYYFNKSL